MPTQTKSALEELEELRANLREAEKAVQDRDAELAQANRGLDRAMGPLRDYHAAVEAGEREPDPKEEKRLTRAVEEAGAFLTWQTVTREGQRYYLPRDERAHARLEGARRVVQRCEAEVEHFIRSEFGRIAEELAVHGVEARDQLDEAWKTLDAASSAWTKVAREWHALARVEMTPVSPEDIPTNPLRAIGPEVLQGFPLPMPRPLMPEHEQDAEERRAYAREAAARRAGTNFVDGGDWRFQPEAGQ